MGYRVNYKPCKPEDELPRLPIRNGSTMTTEFECFYPDFKRGHDPHWHDHVGWPDPHHPGHACQMHPPRDEFRWLSNGIIIKGKPIPIDFIDEGFSQDLLVVFDHEWESWTLSAFAQIDPIYHNVIHLSFEAQLPMFEDKPIDERFTLFLHDTKSNTNQAVLRGILSILPGNYSQRNESN